MEGRAVVALLMALCGVLNNANKEHNKRKIVGGYAF